MPIVEITMIEGRTPEAKRRLIAKVTDAIVDAIEAPCELDPHHPAGDTGAALRRRGKDQGKDRGAVRADGLRDERTKKFKGRIKTCTGFPWAAGRSSRPAPRARRDRAAARRLRRAEDDQDRPRRAADRPAGDLHRATSVDASSRSRCSPAASQHRRHEASAGDHRARQPVESEPRRRSRQGADPPGQGRYLTTFATPETVNPVADQCELKGVPCVTNDCPLEPYFFGRNGDPKKGFDWTYNFFFSAVNMAEAYYDAWDQVPTNKVLGALWPNDNDGRAFSRSSPACRKSGFKIVDPGRFDLPANNFSAQIAAFKAASAEIVAGVLPPPDSPSSERGGAAGLQAEGHHDGQGDGFPRGVSPLGERAEAFRSRSGGRRPSRSSRASPAARRNLRRLREGDRQAASMTLGFRHALFEAAFDALKARPESRRSGLDPRRHRQHGLQVDRRADQFQEGAVPEHQRDPARHRPVAEGQEVAARPRHRRQHDRADVPSAARCSRSSMADRAARRVRRRRPGGGAHAGARGVSRRFGGLRVIEGLDLTVARGEILGVLGPNGAGKSTLFNLIAGVLPPSAGASSSRAATSRR